MKPMGLFFMYEWNIKS